MSTISCGHSQPDQTLLVKPSANGKVYVLFILRKEEDIVRFWTWLINRLLEPKQIKISFYTVSLCNSSQKQISSGQWYGDESSFPGSFGRQDKRRKEGPVLFTTETRWCVYHVRRIVIYNGAVSLTIQPSTDVHKIKLRRLKWKKKKKIGYVWEFNRVSMFQDSFQD